MKKIIMSFLFAVLFLGMTGIAMAYSIRDDATGGDCTSIGIWDWATKTCTLTTDVYETIQIDSDYVTLDGKGRTITGNGTGSGVYLYGRTGVIIENLNVTGFLSGIYLGSSSNNTLTENIILSTRYGIYIDISNNNTITNNIVNLNEVYGIILSWYSNNNIIRGNTALNNQYGIGLYAMSDNNTLTENAVSIHVFGIIISDSSNNTFIDNTVSNNSVGIGIVSSVKRPSSNNNATYNNNFIHNGIQVWVREGTDNIFNLDKPIGGNYWSNFSEGCLDTNNDDFCDAPYYFTGGVDYLPWTRQSGWEVPVDTIPPTVTATATPDILWPSNHKMVDVRIDGSAIDKESGIALVVITVTDEYGIYNMTVPIFGSIIQLEAWREGTDRDGRHYTITVVVTDVAGNQSTATTQVVVSHDMGR